MSGGVLLFLSLFVPLLGSVLIAMSGDRPNQREGATLATALILAGVVVAILCRQQAGEALELELFNVIPGAPLRLEVEPLGMLFALVASGLWIVNSLYSIGYMRGNSEKKQTRFYICFALAIFGAIGVAFSGNLLTLFIFYEVLTLSTYPLVAHKENADAKRGARIYLGVLLTTSIGFLLPAIVWTYAATGEMNFIKGGILDGHVSAAFAPWLLALFMFGIGKAALMPFHLWLPSAMVAPTPVSALLHAVAVVKAGVFSVLKVAIYVFGTDYLAETGAATWLVWIAAFSLLAASLIAMTKDNLKARLAYSTISQLSYVTLGAALAAPAGVVGGAMQIAMHACGKITLFFCAGAIYTMVHKTEISDLKGLGKAMPLTFTAFLIGALSIIGAPPLGGAWAKWYLLEGAADAGWMLMIAVLVVSSLLNVAYLIPIPARAFFGPAPKTAEDDHPHDEEEGAPPAGWGPAFMTPLERRHWLVVAPPCFTAFLCLVLFLCGPWVYALVAPLAQP